MQLTIPTLDCHTDKKVTRVTNLLNSDRRLIVNMIVLTKYLEIVTEVAKLVSKLMTDNHQTDDGKARGQSRVVHQ